MKVNSDKRKLLIGLGATGGMTTLLQSSGSFAQTNTNNSNFLFETVHDMTSATGISAGDIVTTSGYHQSDDGGANTYRVNIGVQNYPETGKQINHATLNLHFEALFPGGFLSITQFGAKAAKPDVNTEGERIYTDQNASANTYAIQSAINYASSKTFGYVPGIYIPSGVFVINGDIEIKSYTSIFGDGDQSIIKLIADASGSEYSMFNINGDGANSITLRNFSLWGDNNNQGNSPTVYGLRIRPINREAHYNTFDNLYIKEMQSSAVYIENKGLENSRFSQCMFRDCKGYANFYSKAMKKVELDTCRIRSGKVGSGHGLLIDGKSNRFISINGCRIDDNTGYGLYISNIGDSCDIINNQIISNNLGGIRSDRNSQSVIQGNNLIENDGDYQILVEQGPQINGEGVLFEKDCSTVVNNNNIFGGSGGIALKGTKYANVSSNIISEVNNGNYAIYAEEAQFCSIQGNSINNVPKHGIFINQGSHNKISDNLVVNVSLENDGVYSGIVVDSYSVANSLQLNKVVSSNDDGINAKHGIWIANALAENNFVTNNTIHHTITAIQDDGTGTEVQAGNYT